MWVAAFTGGTAVLASWVTTLGNTRAARAQAETTEQAQRRSRIRELRRAAYLDVMEQAHITSQLYYRVYDAYVQLAEPEARLARFEELRVELRAAYDPFMRSVRVVVLEGPAPAAEAAETVLQAAATANGALWRIARGQDGARARFDDAQTDFLRRLEQFVETARGAMEGA